MLAAQCEIQYRADANQWRALWQASEKRNVDRKRQHAAEISALKARAAEAEQQYQKQITELTAKIKDLQHRLFGKKSEQKKSRSEASFISRFTL